MTLHQVSTQSNHPCEQSIKSCLLVIFFSCEATIFYIASFKLKIYQDTLKYISTPSTKSWLQFINQLLCAIFASSWTEMMFVKQVPFWLVHLVWNFYRIIISPNHQALPNFSLSGHSVWGLLQVLHIWSVVSFALQVLDRLFLLSCKLAEVIILAYDQVMPKPSTYLFLCLSSQSTNTLLLKPFGIISNSLLCPWTDFLLCLYWGQQSPSPRQVLTPRGCPGHALAMVTAQRARQNGGLATVLTGRPAPASFGSPRLVK
jgi:hypothetical protein